MGDRVEVDWGNGTKEVVTVTGFGSSDGKLDDLVKITTSDGKPYDFPIGYLSTGRARVLDGVEENTQPAPQADDATDRTDGTDNVPTEQTEQRKGDKQIRKAKKDLSEAQDAFEKADAIQKFFNNVAAGAEVTDEEIALFENARRELEDAGYELEIVRAHV